MAAPPPKVGSEGQQGFERNLPRIVDRPRTRGFLDFSELVVLGLEAVQGGGLPSPCSGGQKK